MTALKTAEETNLSAESRSVGQIIKGNLFTYFNLIFTVLAILVIATGLLRSMTFLPVVMRLASRRVLVHDMKCIEALARVDVL